MSQQEGRRIWSEPARCVARHAGSRWSSGMADARWRPGAIESGRGQGGGAELYSRGGGEGRARRATTGHREKNTGVI